MSDLYKEALAEAAKLREVAEQDARNAILEQISPYIKKMIMKETTSLFSEQEELVQSDLSMEELPKEDSATMASPEVLTTMPEELPVAPTDGGEVVNVPMQTLGDGKVVIDFKDLFADEGKVSDIVGPKDIVEPASTEVTVVTPPAIIEPATESGPTPAPETAGAAAEEEKEVAPAVPTAPITEATTVKQLEHQLAEMALKIDELYTKNVSALTKDAYKTKLFSLLEQLDKLAANKAITPRQAELNENRLEFLFLHLKEAKIDNSYNKKKDGNKTMTTLKEFAAKLFESADAERLAQDSQHTGDTGLPVHRSATQHAQSVDGVQADLFEGEAQTVEARHAAAGSVDADELEGLEGEEGAWEEALMEEIQAALRDELDAHEEPEAGEVPAAVEDSGYYIDEAALKEAVRKLRKENAKKKLQEMMGSKMEEGMDEDLVLNVSLPADVEEQLDAEDLEVDLMLSGEEDMGAEEEMVDLDMSDEGEEEMGSEEEEMLLTDEEGEEEEEEEEEEMEQMVMESRRGRRALLEARAREIKARRLAEAKRAEVATLKRDMAETNLFLSKLVYLNKFLVREDLSRKVKQQIVEHLDRATTIAEAKDIYGKIVKKLDEAAAAHTAPVVGSASKPTTAGSARLNESVSKAATLDGSADPVIGTFEKWQILANIKKNNG